MSKTKPRLPLLFLVVLSGVVAAGISLYTPQAYAATNLVPNPSAEIAQNSTTPQNWQTSAWGSNSPQYKYLSGGGHSGNRALRVTMKNYNDGDAKWVFTPVAVDSTQQFMFSDYYYATVPTEVYASFIMPNGNEAFSYVGAATANANWTAFKGSFAVPTGAQTVTVFHLIHAPGTLTTDDYSLAPYSPTGFSRALISLTFDDGIASTYNNGLPLLQKYGFTATDYIISGTVNQPGSMTTAMLQSLQSKGHEIGSHTVSHPDLTTLASRKLNRELNDSKTALQALVGVPVTNFAAPYGAINPAVTAAVKPLYKSMRGVEPGFNSKDAFNSYDLKAISVDLSSSQADLASKIQYAKATHTWLIFLIHAVDPNTAAAGEYDTTPAQLDALLAAIKASGAPVVTVNQALSELTPQL